MAKDTVITAAALIIALMLAGAAFSFGYQFGGNFGGFASMSLIQRDQRTHLLTAH